MPDDVIVVEPSTTDVLNTMTPEQRHDWRMTGNLPEAKPKEESAPPKKEAKTEESQPSTEKSSAAEKTAKTAPASEPGTKTQEQGAKRDTPADKRIKELLGKNKALENELKTLKESKAAPTPRAEEKKPETAKIETKAETKAETAPRPKPDDKKDDGTPKYANLDEYMEALTDWKVDQKLDARFTDRDKQQRTAEIEKQVKANNEQIQTNWKTRVEDASKRHADFKEVALADDIVKQIKPGTVLDAAILKRPLGTEILYHFAKHPDELKAITDLLDKGGDGPAEVMFEIGKLEQRLSAESAPKKETKKPDAPAKPQAEVRPHTEVGGRAAAPADEEEAALESGDFGAFRRSGNAREMAKSKVH